MIRSLFCCLLALAGPAFALDPATPLSQYNHYAWRVTDGTFRAEPSSVAQTGDGYLWITTRSGVYRFDGISFTLFTGSGKGWPIRSQTVYTALADRDGSLWLTGADLEHWQNGVLTHYPADFNPDLGIFLDAYQTRDGSIWVDRARKRDPGGPLCKVVGPNLKCYGRTQGIAADYLSTSILEDADGSLWTHSDQAILHWDPRAMRALPGGIELHDGVDRIQALALDGQGGLVVALEGAELSRLRNGVLEPYAVAGLERQKIGAQQLFYDSHKSLWVGTDKRGLYRITGSRVEHFGAADGLSSDTVNAVTEDHEGNMWVLTSQGVDRFRGQKVVTYSARQGLSADLVNAVAAGHDGAVWISNFHTVDMIRGDTVKSIPMPSADSVIYSIFEDRDQRLWMGLDRNLVLYTGGIFTPVSVDGAPTGLVEALTQDSTGAIWAITYPGGAHARLLRLEQGRIEDVFTYESVPVASSPAIAPDPIDGVWVPLDNGNIAHWHGGHLDTIALHRPPGSRLVSALVASHDGSVYASSSGDLTGWRQGRVQRLSEANGLPCGFIITIVAGTDALWGSGDCGIFSVSNAELERWWKSPDARLNFLLYDALDGAQPSAPALSPRSTRSSDGRIWFANHSVLQVVDPAANASNTLAPPVHIERIVADRTSYPPSGDIHLPALTRDLQIDYTALSFSIPGKVRFRYRLEGHDDKWIDAQTRRQAFYTDLRPGNYRFSVTAANNDGVWNQTGAAVGIRIAPAFYQRKAFWIVCAILALGVLRLLYLLRVRKLQERMKLRLEARASERERIARDLHDTLLQGIQGLIYRMSAISERLPSAIPQRSEIADALDRAEAMLVDGRDRVTGLRRQPNADATLVDALGSVATELTAQSASRYSAAVLGEPRLLKAEVGEELYRIGAEALVNAFRHAAASEVEIELRYDRDSFTLSVRDNGRGFDGDALQSGHRAGHFGLLGIKERAERIGGELQIWSRNGAGTEITCRIDAAAAYPESSGGRARTWMYRFWTNPVRD